MRHDIPILNAVDGSLIFGRVLLDEVIASNQATVDLDLVSGFSKYEIELYGIVPGTDTNTLQMRFSFDNGVTFNSSAIYNWSIATHITTVTITTNATDTEIQLSVGTLGSATGENYSGLLRIDNLGGGLGASIISGNAAYKNNGGTTTGVKIAATLTSTTAGITNIRFFMASGNIASGTFTSFGIM